MTSIFIIYIISGARASGGIDSAVLIMLQPEGVVDLLIGKSEVVKTG